MGVQNPYQLAEQTLDRLNSDFNRSSEHSRKLALGALICFGLGVALRNPGLIKASAGFAVLSSANYMNAQGRGQQALVTAEQQIRQADRAKWSLQRWLNRQIETVKY